MEFKFMMKREAAEWYDITDDTWWRSNPNPGLQCTWNGTQWERVGVDTPYLTYYWYSTWITDYRCTQMRVTGTIWDQGRDMILYGLGVVTLLEGTTPLAASGTVIYTLPVGGWPASDLVGLDIGGFQTVTKIEVNVDPGEPGSEPT